MDKMEEEIEVKLCDLCGYEHTTKYRHNLQHNPSEDKSEVN
jgi:hypothetical protein